MRIKVQIKIIELEPNNYHIGVSGEFLTGEKTNWIIDTGASKTVFDKNLTSFYDDNEAATDEIHTAGINDTPQQITIAAIKPFQLGKLQVQNLKAGLLDLSNINQLYTRSTGFEICGLIGGDFLMHYKAKIDYKKRVLILNT